MNPCCGNCKFWMRREGWKPDNTGFCTAPLPYAYTVTTYVPPTRDTEGEDCEVFVGSLNV